MLTLQRVSRGFGICVSYKGKNKRTTTTKTHADYFKRSAVADVSTTWQGLCICVCLKLGGVVTHMCNSGWKLSAMRITLLSFSFTGWLLVQVNIYNYMSIYNVSTGISQQEGCGLSRACLSRASQKWHFMCSNFLLSGVFNRTALLSQ